MNNEVEYNPEYETVTQYIDDNLTVVERIDVKNNYYGFAVFSSNRNSFVKICPNRETLEAEMNAFIQEYRLTA
jgi:hypothetical protein